MTTDPTLATPVAKKSGTRRRVLTVVPLVPIILWLMFAGPPMGFRVFVLLATAIAGYELMRMKVYHSQAMLVWGTLATVLFAAAIVTTASKAALLAALFLVIIGALVLNLIRPDPIDGASGRVAWMIGGPVFVGGGLAAMLLLHGLPQGGWWVLLSMAIAWGSDTSAYFIGRKYGATKLYQRVSPKKTMEGSLGGVAGSVVFASLISIWLERLSTMDAIAIAVLAGTVGQAGDLLMSLLKRSSGVKDSGGILPGHGGILDRVDALMFVAMCTWLYANYIAVAA